MRETVAECCGGSDPRLQGLLATPLFEDSQQQIKSARISVAVGGRGRRSSGLSREIRGASPSSLTAGAGGAAGRAGKGGVRLAARAGGASGRAGRGMALRRGHWRPELEEYRAASGEEGTSAPSGPEEQLGWKGSPGEETGPRKRVSERRSIGQIERSARARQVWTNIERPACSSLPLIVREVQLWVREVELWGVDVVVTSVSWYSRLE